MMFAGLFFLLLTGGSSFNHTWPPEGEGVYSQSYLESGSTYNYIGHFDDGRAYDQNLSKSALPSHCTYHNMIRHFNLTDKVKFYMSRPTRNSLRPTEIKLNVYLYSILDVKEKEQELVAFFWIDVDWKNEFIEWKLENFCGIRDIILPSELVWKPDITIEEIIQTNKLFQTPYLSLRFHGGIFQRNGLVLVSTCKFRFYRFPFDTQTCSLTFKSIQHSERHLKLTPGTTGHNISNITREVMKTESEWLLMDVKVEAKELQNFGYFLSVFVYTMTIKRRSVLYVANFIVPILFFLCLDLASFLITENGGEKLSFKVTVLLAVTVMQLILNDILPSSSDRIPLIAVYCIGVFTLMMLSLLETILMMYLMEKDNVSQYKETDKDQSLDDNCRDQWGKVQNCFRDNNKSTPCVCFSDESTGEKPSELLTEASSIQLTEEIHDSENLTDELREVLKTVALLLSSRKEDKKPGYWTRMTKKINWIYFIFYIITTSVFLGSVFLAWLSEDTNNHTESDSDQMFNNSTSKG